MMQLFRRLLRDRTAAAAAEMILVLPLITALMFGAVELGYYYFTEHAVQKSIRDAARFAGRLPVSNFDCSTLTVNAIAAQQIRRIARYGTPDASTPSRIRGWSDDDMTTVSLTCLNSSTLSYVNAGMYKDFPGGTVPVVTVTADVPHPTLFATMGLSNAAANRCASQQNSSWTCLRLWARSQSAVYGA